MIGYLIVWVFFAGLALLVAVLVLIQLIREGLKKLAQPAKARPPDPPPA